MINTNNNTIKNSFELNEGENVPSPLMLQQQNQNQMHNQNNSNIAIISVKYENKDVKAFLLEYNDAADRFYISNFSYHSGGTCFSFPTYMDYDKKVYHSDILGKDENIFDDCLFEIHTNETKESIIDFYNHSFSGIVVEAVDYHC